MQLSNAQKAIQKAKGPCLILAGAGTGKTHTIVEKIKHLIQNDIYKPERIVCMTFSNEAANSLQTRIQKSLSLENKKPIIKTFHAFSADLLKEHGEKISINNNFQILEPNEAKIILHQNLKIPAGNCHKYVSSIGNAKDLGIALQDLQNNLDRKIEPYGDLNLNKKLENIQFEYQTLYLRKDQDKHELSKQIKDLKSIINQKKFIKAWNAYEKLKKIKNYQDYSDLNNNALILLEKFPELASNYDYIIVDEFQDTNKVQLELLFKLAPHHNITAVGDINQSIYRFRGAYNLNLEDFKNHFQLSKEGIVNLDKSYRSSNKILRVAHKLITNNYENPLDSFQVHNKFDQEGAPIEIYELKDSKEEARKVVELIEKSIQSGIDLNEICVMFRNHQYGRIIKQSLDFKEIPYCSVNKASLLNQRSVKTVIDYLTILDRLKKRASGGEQAWWDLIHHLNLPEQDLIRVGKYIKQQRNSENISAKLLNDLLNVDLTDSGRLSMGLLLERIKIMIPNISEDIPKLIKHVIHCSGVLRNDSQKKDKEILLNLNKFHDLAKTHSNFHEPDLSSFIHYLDVISELKIEFPAPEIETNGIRLMTLHSTKGLEFKTVIITNLAQKRFPMEKYSNNSLIPIELSPEFKNIPHEDLDYLAFEQERKHQMFEERRLCYVAFTRTKNNLFLTYAQKYGNKKFHPSQFLQEINYKQNPDLIFNIDSEEKYILPEINLLPAPNFSSIIHKENFDYSLQKIITEKPKSTLPEKEISFSPSSLLLFEECQKKYEYKYIYNMPEEKTIHWDAMRLGSFVHLILEKGVFQNLDSIKQFLDLSKEIHLSPNWDSVDLEQAEHLIKVFYERNKNKFSKFSKTEQKLSTEINGIKFTGFADRIDYNPDGIEIIDYKTGSGNVPPKNRNWQLGYYALAASEIGKVKKITLDMLKHEKPLEFFLDAQGNAKATYSDRMEFNIYDVRDELLETAKRIIEAKKSSFKPCLLEKSCEFCNEYVYNQ